MNGTGPNDEAINVSLIHYEVTELRRNPTYIHYYINWFSLLSTGLIPVGLLIFLNGSIYVKIVETTRLREKCRVHLTNKQSSNSNIPEIVMASSDSSEKKKPTRIPHPPNNVSSKDFKMALIMVAIVMVFLLCHLPR